MKKIIFLLLSLISFSFAQIDFGTTYPTNLVYQFDSTTFFTSEVLKSSSSAYYTPTQCSTNYSGTRPLTQGSVHWYYSPNSRTFYKFRVYSADGSCYNLTYTFNKRYSSIVTYTWSDGTTRFVPEGPTCTANEVDINGTCEVIGEQGTCATPNVRLSDGTCSSCTTSQHYSSTLETCVDNCIPTSVTNPNTTDWIDLGMTDADICTNYLIEKEIDGTFLSADDGCGGTSSACYGQAVSPCDNLNNPYDSIPVGGYIYKGIVSNSSICSSYVVDGTTYLDSKTIATDTDCSKNTDLYCYLLPINSGDSNLTNTVIPTANEDGTIPNDSNLTTLSYNPNSDTTDPTVLNNQILQDLKDNLQDTSLDIKDYHSWFKNKFGKWEPQTNAENQLSAQNKTTDAVNSLLSPIKDITSAINSQNSNLGEKLDTINQSIQDKNLTVDIDLNKTNTLLSDILEGTNDGNASNDSSGVMSYINTTYENFKTQYDNVQNQVDTAIGVFNGKGLDTVLTSNSVNSCSKTFVFDISSSISKDIVIDPCIVFSQSREYMYTFSYIGFSAMYISFLVSMIVKV